MKYTDRIYGSIDINESVIMEIINSSDFSRLKGIDQAGYFEVYFPGTKHSRFEHSVGCYLFLKRFNASLEEQIAGLIHDMSHSAFSHTADYIFKSGRGADHNYQDDIFVDFVKKTKIPEILHKYKFDVDYILNEHNFPLQENNLPNLCVDRIDYSLRGAVIYKITTKKEIQKIINNLKVIDNKWVFANYSVAQEYANIFKKLNDIYYSNKETAAMFLRTSNWIKYALDNNYIQYRDLFTIDKNVIDKINKNLVNDKKLQNLWAEMHNSDIVMCEKENDLCKKVIVKSRIVDPLFLDDRGVINKISDFNKIWANKIIEDSKPKVYYVEVA